MRDLVCGMLADPVTVAATANLRQPADDGQAVLIGELRAVESKLERLVDLYTEGRHRPPNLPGTPGHARGSGR